jgi:hypothetical protein
MSLTLADLHTKVMFTPFGDEHYFGTRPYGVLILRNPWQLIKRNLHFHDVLLHQLRCDRLIRRPRGNPLSSHGAHGGGGPCGTGGSGSSSRGRSIRAGRASGLAGLLELPSIGIHGGLDCYQIVLDVLQNPLFNRPAEEVQLAHRGLKKGVARDLEHNPLAAAKGVEQLFGICLQLGLVVRVDEELLAVQNIGRVVLFGVVGHEPVNEAEGNVRGSLEKAEHLGFVIAIGVEALEAAHD